jgi:hypothetical protein
MSVVTIQCCRVLKDAELCNGSVKNGDLVWFTGVLKESNPKEALMIVNVLPKNGTGRKEFHLPDEDGWFLSDKSYISAASPELVHISSLLPSIEV